MDNTTTTSAAQPKPATARQPAFIHSKLDDYGLPPSVFRVYCHIVRRAGMNREFFESSENCAGWCDLNVKTVRAGFHALLACGMIVLTEAKAGCTRRYRVGRLEEWASSPYNDGRPTQKTGRVSKRVGGLPKRTLPTPPKEAPTKVIPPRLTDGRGGKPLYPGENAKQLD